MAGTFVATGAYSNLTRLELEQLRKADFFAGGKALTVGDSALPPEGVVGPGNINAEPYLTSQLIPVEDLLLTPVTQPGLVLFNQMFCGGQGTSIINGANGPTLLNVVPVEGSFIGTGFFGNYIQISGASASGNNGTFPVGQTASYAVANVLDNGGLIQIQTMVAHNLATGNTVVISNIEGLTVANGTWVVTVLDSTNFTLNGSVWANLFEGGGVVNCPTQITFVNPNASVDGNNGSIVWQVVTDTNTWYGPSFVSGAITGKATGYGAFNGIWYDGGTNFTALGVLPGDQLLVKTTANITSTTNANTYAVGTVEIVGPNQLTIDSINNSYGSPGTPTQFQDWILISSITDAGAILSHLILVTTSSPHGYSTGENIGIYGVANLSRTWQITVQSPTTFTLGNTLFGSNPTGPYTFTPGSATAANVYQYVIVRPNAVQLFAVPGSGATGFEQSFLAVVPGAPIHNLLAPTIDQINANRVTNLIPGQYGLNSTVDRADAVYPEGPELTLNLLGYRIVLYPDNGTGTGPNLATPIATLNPVIAPNTGGDPIPSTDQRFTVDYTAGVIRFSCEPQIGGQIKVAGGVNATTGRLNLYAVFWAINPSFAPGATTSLYAQSISPTYNLPFSPSRVYWNPNLGSWAFDTVQLTTAERFTTPLAGYTASGSGGLPEATGTSSVTVQFLSGMFSGVQGGNLTLSNASIGVNNGTFPITAVTNNSTVTITNPGFGGATVTNVVNHGGAFQFVTALPTGLVTGDIVYIVGVNGTGGFTTINGQSYTITVQDSTHFTLNGTTFSGTYISGGNIQDNNAQQFLTQWSVTVAPVNITTLDVADPSSSIIKRLNAACELTCGDGVVSFGDFNGTDALNQAFAYWQGLQSPPKTCNIHVKHGTFTITGGMVIGWNGSVSTAGYELRITGDSKSTTLINSGLSGSTKIFILGAGCQLSLENLTLASTISAGVNMVLGGSFRARGVAFLGAYINYGSGTGTILDNVAPLRLSTQTVLPDLILCEDCEFDFVTEGGQFVFNNFSAKNCTWRDCTFAGLGQPSLYQFTAISTRQTSYTHFTWEECTFTVTGVGTTSATEIANGGGLISVLANAASDDLMMTLDHFLYEECTVTSTDTTSASVVLMHLFPYSFQSTGFNNPPRVQIGTVTIRGGSWSIPQGRGNDFPAFFLMCYNPIVENFKLNGGGTQYNGLGTSPGRRGNGWYTNEMMLALSGTLGWQFEPTLTVSPCAFATIAASGNGIFTSIGDIFGFIVSNASGTVTFESTNASTMFPVFSPGMVGMQITIEGAATTANNGTFPITSVLPNGSNPYGQVTYTNASAVFPDANSGSITWTITSTMKSGMVVRNLSVQNMPLGSSSGDLCLVGPSLNSGPVDVDGVFVTNNGGVFTNAIPMHRIHIRPGAVWEPVSASAFSPGTYVTTTASLPTGTIHVASTSNFHTIGASGGQGSLLINGSLVQYTGTTSTTFTGCTGGSGTITANVTPVIQAMQMVVPGTGGSNGMFRNITWQALNGIESPSSDGVGYVTFFGNGYNSSGIVSLAYTGDLHVEDVKVLTLPAFYPARSFGQQFDIVTNTGITCTELWGTYFAADEGGLMTVPLALRGRLRLRNCYVEGCGQDGWGGVPAINTGGSQAILVGTSSIITLSDFKTIDASSLEVHSNMQNNSLGNNLQVSGIQVLNQFSQRGGFNGVAGVFSSPTLTWEGLSGMTPQDVDSFLLISGSSHSGNNGVFLITAVLSATSVQVSNSSGATGISECAWAIANNLVAAWNLTNNVARFDEINADNSIVGIASYWTLGTAQVAVAGESTVLSNGTLSGNYVNMTTGSTFSAGQVVPYALQSIDQNGGGQFPAVVFLGNTGVETNDSGPFAGVTWLNYYAATTATAVTPGNQARGFLTAFTTGQGTYGNSGLMIFNAGSLKTP